MLWWYLEGIAGLQNGGSCKRDVIQYQMRSVVAVEVSTAAAFFKKSVRRSAESKMSEAMRWAGCFRGVRYIPHEIPNEVYLVKHRIGTGMTQQANDT